MVIWGILLVESQDVLSTITQRCNLLPHLSSVRVVNVVEVTLVLGEEEPGLAPDPDFDVMCVEVRSRVPRQGVVFGGRYRNRVLTVDAPIDGLGVHFELIARLFVVVRDLLGGIVHDGHDSGRHLGGLCAGGAI